MLLEKPPAKKGLHHGVDLFRHVFDQQWNSRADTPNTEEGKIQLAGRETTFPPSQDSSSGRVGLC